MKKLFQLILLLTMGSILSGCGEMVFLLFEALEPPQPPPTYTVTYDPNGATSGSVPIDSNTYEEDEIVPVLTNTGSLARYQCFPWYNVCKPFRFDNWNTRADGSGSRETGGAYLTMKKDNVTLYAQWI